MKCHKGLKSTRSSFFKTIVVLLQYIHLVAHKIAWRMFLFIFSSSKHKPGCMFLFIYSLLYASTYNGLPKNCKKFRSTKQIARKITTVYNEEVNFEKKKLTMIAKSFLIKEHLLSFLLVFLENSFFVSR